MGEWLAGAWPSLQRCVRRVRTEERKCFFYMESDSSVEVPVGVATGIDSVQRGLRQSHGGEVYP